MKGKAPGQLALLEDRALWALWRAARWFVEYADERTREAQPRHRGAWERNAENGRKGVANVEREAQRRGLLLTEDGADIPPGRVGGSHPDGPKNARAREGSVGNGPKKGARGQRLQG